MSRKSLFKRFRSKIWNYVVSCGTSRNWFKKFFYINASIYVKLYDGMPSWFKKWVDEL